MSLIGFFGSPGITVLPLNVILVLISFVLVWYAYVINLKHTRPLDVEVDYPLNRPDLDLVGPGVLFE